MVGLIQKIFLDLVRNSGGEETLSKVLQGAGLPTDKTYQINDIYSDEEWQRLLASGLKVLNITVEQAEEAYADLFLQDALKRFPKWFDMCKTSYDFLVIQPTIHNCFATSVIDQKDRDAINDKFVVDKMPAEPYHLITHYRSHNQHCGLYKALAKCVLKHYNDEAVIEEKQCLREGGEECEIHLYWTKLGGAACEARRA